jgi:AcrR family transcriptional regulator
LKRSIKNSRIIERRSRQKEKILKAAVRLFWQKAFLGTSIDDIARAADVNKATIYYYFESKSEILYEIIMEHVQEIYKDALPIVDSSLSPEDKLALLIDNNLKTQVSHPGRAALSHREWRELPLKLRREYSELRKQYAAIFEGIIREIIDKNSAPVKDEKLATLFTMGLVNSLIHWYKPSGRCSAEEIKSQAITYIMLALSCHNPQSNNFSIKAPHLVTSTT